MTDTKEKKPKKEQKRKKKSTKKDSREINVQKYVSWGISLFFLVCSITVVYPHSHNFFLSRVISYYLSNTFKVPVHFSDVYLNLWDFSINLKNFRIDNPKNFPEEPAIQMEHFQTKIYVSNNLEIIYDMYINHLKFSLYYLPNEGINIGILYHLIKKQEKQPDMLDNIHSLVIDKVSVVISQNLEPQKIEINTSNQFSFNTNNLSKFDRTKNLLDFLIDTFLINQTEIPEDFRRSLINSKKLNTI